jgi:hypothetical protein
MEQRTKQILLALIFAIALGTRLYFAEYSETFTHDAYFDYRQIEHIREKGLPVFNDELSYGGREFLFLPAFHYVMAFFSLFIPLEQVLRVLPNIFSASIIFIVYLFTKQLTKNDYISLFTSLSSAFIPIHFVANMNSISPLSLQIPLIFLALYCFIRSNQKKYLALFAIFTFVLPLVHGSAIILILTFALYTVLSKIMSYKIGKKSIELIMFYIFITLWILLVFFKNAFLTHGVAIIWQNIPFLIRNQYFVKTTVLEIIISIGLLPIISGAYSCYVYVLRTKEKSFYLLLSLVLCLLVLIWARLITPIIGLSLLGIVLVILSGALLNFFVNYLDKTKLSRFKMVFVLIFVFIFVLNLVTLTVLFASQPITVPKSDFEAVQFLANQTKKTVIAPVELGHLLTAVAGQPNVADKSFFLIGNVEQRINDLVTVYNTPFQIRAVSVMDKYDVGYLYIPEGKDVKYIEGKCFELIYNESVKIYEITCGIQTGGKS